VAMAVAFVITLIGIRALKKYIDSFAIFLYTNGAFDLFF
jgi:hypothetical protein